MINHGVISDPRPQEKLDQDHIASGETGLAYEELRPTGDWSAIECYGEHQSLPGVFDAVNCTHEGSGHVIETSLILAIQQGKITKEALDFLKTNGYFYDVNDLRSLRFSKRAAAILGGNTINGNYFQKAWDTWRNIGASPDWLLPFGGTDFYSYTDPKLITQQIKDLNAEFLSYFEIKYDKTVYFDWFASFSDTEVAQTKIALKQCPLNINIPGHSLMMSAIDEPNRRIRVLEDYVPFDRYNAYDNPKIITAWKGVIGMRLPPPPPVKPIHTFNIDLTYKMTGVEIYWLQKCLLWEMSTGNLTGIGLLQPSDLNPDPTQAYFGPKTMLTVMAFQEKYRDEILVPAGLTYPSGRCMTYTRAALNKRYS